LLNPLYGGDALSVALTAAVDTAVQKEIHQQKLVGTAIGVIRGGKIVYLKAYGDADLATKKPVTLETVFNWASNSKPLAAVLAMQLVEKGLLDLDADVRTTVPEFPDKIAIMTCRQILCHQSGIPHYTNGKIIPTLRKHTEKDPSMDPLISLEKFDKSPLIFQPGAKTAYSSYAYVLLSAAIQKAGKQPFAEQVRERVTKPLALTSFEWDTVNLKPSWATGYEMNNGTIVVTPDVAHDWKHGAGGFKSNIKDFARWAQALVNRELVTEATQSKLWTPQPLKDKSPTTWGLGFVLGGSGDKLRVSHGGSQNETRTIMMLVPKERRGIVVMSNCNFAEVGKIAAAVDAALGGAKSR